MSRTSVSRRRFIEGIGATALAGSAASATGGCGVQAGRRQASARDMPAICMGMSSRAGDADMRRTKQLGVDHVLMGGPAIPWQESALATSWTGSRPAA